MALKQNCVKYRPIQNFESLQGSAKFRVLLGMRNRESLHILRQEYGLGDTFA